MKKDDDEIPLSKALKFIRNDLNLLWATILLGDIAIMLCVIYR